MPITINGSGTVTGLAVGGLPDGIVDTDTLANNAVTSAKSSLSTGKIGQVIQSIKSDAYQNGATSFYDMAGTDQNGSGSIFCVKITPTATSSKILVLMDLVFSCNDAYHMNMRRGIGGTDTTLYIGDAVTNKKSHTMGGRHSLSNVPSLSWRHNLHHNVVYLDSPSTTSEVTYKTQWKVEESGYDIKFNYNWKDGDDSRDSVRSASSITCMEYLA